VARGTNGYLFTVTHRGLQVAAPLHGDIPPSALEEKVSGEIHAFIEDDESTVLSEVESATRKQEAPTHDGHGFAISLLTAEVRGAAVVVGAVALNATEHPLRVLPKSVLVDVGTALYEAGDVTEYTLA
jgi:hypothetical protein